MQDILKDTALSLLGLKTSGLILIFIGTSYLLLAHVPDGYLLNHMPACQDHFSPLIVTADNDVKDTVLELMPQNKFVLSP